MKKLNSMSVGMFSVVLFSMFSMMASAHADYSQRLSVGLGIADLRNPSETELELSGEYEYRLHPLLGVGGFVSYIFSSPGITEIGVPQFDLHPLETDFLVSVAPIMETGSLVGGTNFGVRFGTRVPLSLGILSIVPLASVDFISGGPNYTFGLGFGFQI